MELFRDDEREHNYRFWSRREARALVPLIRPETRTFPRVTGSARGQTRGFDGLFEDGAG